MKKATLAFAVAGLLSLAAFGQAFAANNNLKLNPDGFGKQAYSAWKAGEGEADSSGGARQALYFQKMAPTATFSAGVAVVKGLEGMSTGALSGLSWEHRNDGHCGAGAPRWNVNYNDSMGQGHTVFLGCAAAAHSPGTEPGWTKDTFDLTAVEAGGTITSLAIVFDEGTDQGQGYIYLDNITVNDKTWTSASDNGK